MDVKEAVRTAREYIRDVFKDEGIINVGLEEVVYKSGPPRWEVTIGFSRPWDQKGSLVTVLGEGRPARSYKVLRISNDSGKVESLTDRVLKASE